MPAVNRVLVVGAGVCGTVLAIALKQQGVEVDLLELYDDVLGVGVEFSGNTMLALEQIGLIDDFVAEGQPYSRMNVHDSTGNLLIGFDFSRAASPQYPACVAIRRPKFAGATRRRAAQLGIPLRIGMTVTELVNEPDGVRVMLNDGSQDRYDVVVAADGAMSDMRTLLHGDRFRHKPLGQTVLRCYLPRLPEIKDELNSYGGQNVVTLVPLGPDTMYFPLGFPMDPERRFEEHELAPMVLKELEEFTAPIFDRLRPSISKDSYIVARPITELLVPAPWNVGRTMLIGDAAHAFAPHLGNGAGMAIEDAAVLAEVLVKHDDVESAFAEFMQRRFDRVHMVWKNANQICRWEVEGADPKPREELRRDSIEALTATPF